VRAGRAAERGAEGRARPHQPAAGRPVLRLRDEGARRREQLGPHRATRRDLAGLPESLRASYRAAAQERDLDGWAVVNTRSSVDPFLTFADNRALREQVWKKFKSRGDNNDANDTKATIAQIVKLRAERARLLGYESHAHWRMEDTMARRSGARAWS
jgi:peptidyl-dipeptidase Dcp